MPRVHATAATLSAVVALAAAAAGRGAVSDPVYSGPPGSGAVAITFDDGPGPQTPAIVRRLRRAGARATFFQVGVNVERYPQLARLAGTVGEVANHTYRHADLRRLTAPAIAAELARASVAIERATGRRPRLFRPPYGSTDGRVTAAGRRLGLREVLWSVDTEDWRHATVQPLLERIRSQLRPGGIVLFHDHGRATLAALDWLLAELERRGLRAVTVSELLAPPAPTSTPPLPRE